MNTPLLDTIIQPSDLKKINRAQLPTLCAEIRAFLVESVSKTGGHLSSNLGVVELTVALHYALSSPNDKFIFDVGHQCYTHKILTGRRDAFGTLRALDGISGFPKPLESPHDAFVAGHGNTSISAAIGMARAKKLKNEPGKLIAIIGDVAFTGGMVYEGLNNVDQLDNLVIILNDNTMSISKNVGAMAHYLTRLRTAPRYFQLKERTAVALDHIPVVGAPIKTGLQFTKTRLRQALFQSTWFENLGLHHVGPFDGHDVVQLAQLFANLQQQSEPLFIHLVTKKGKGYQPAEENPGEFHGVSTFNPTALVDPDVAQKESFSTAFGKALDLIGNNNEKVCAITAAMKYGTGLQFFYHQHPNRFFDVGMAEQHAVTFAAGLASQGMLPVIGIYSTFLQRGYDQILHDVKLMNLPVLFAIDRAGIVPGDGETHQGIYDPAYLRSAGVRTISPSNYAELLYWLQELLAHPQGAVALRYPRGGESTVLRALPCTGATFDCVLKTSTPNLAIVSYGSETEDAFNAAQALALQGIQTDCYKLLQITPIPDALLELLVAYPCILFAEECIASGGIGEALLFALSQKGWKGTFKLAAIETCNLPHAQVAEIKTRIGLDATGLVVKAKEMHFEN